MVGGVGDDLVAGWVVGWWGWWRSVTLLAFDSLTWKWMAWSCGGLVSSTNKGGGPC